MALPTLDLVVGGLNALGGLVPISSEDSTDEDVQIGWGGIGWGTLQLISGSTGRGRVNRCREFLRTPVEAMGPPMPLELPSDTERRLEAGKSSVTWRPIPALLSHSSLTLVGRGERNFPPTLSLVLQPYAGMALLREN